MDEVTETSYETSKVPSCSIREDMWVEMFMPELIRDRMKWVMEIRPVLGYSEQVYGEGARVGKE